jgi:hypothetical protein
MTCQISLNSYCQLPFYGILEWRWILFQNLKFISQQLRPGPHCSDMQVCLILYWRQCLVIFGSVQQVKDYWIQVVLQKLPVTCFSFCFPHQMKNLLFPV